MIKIGKKVKKLQKGMKVIIDPSSEFVGQSFQVGTVIGPEKIAESLRLFISEERIKEKEKEGWMIIEFSDHEEQFRPSDVLVLSDKEIKEYHLKYREKLFQEYIESVRDQFDELIDETTTEISDLLEKKIFKMRKRFKSLHCALVHQTRKSTSKKEKKQ